MLGAHCFWLHCPPGTSYVRPFADGFCTNPINHMKVIQYSNHSWPYLTATSKKSPIKCLGLFGQTIIAHRPYQSLSVRCVWWSLHFFRVCFSACFEGWCFGKLPHQAKQVAHAPESGGTEDPKACIDDCGCASWKNKSTMPCCGIDACLDPCVGHRGRG